MVRLMAGKAGKGSKNPPNEYFTGSFTVLLICRWDVRRPHLKAVLPFVVSLFCTLLFLLFRCLKRSESVKRLEEPIIEVLKKRNKNSETFPQFPVVSIVGAVLGLIGVYYAASDMNPHAAKTVLFT